MFHVSFRLRRLLAALLVLGLGAGLSACQPKTTAGPDALLSGEVFYRERLALPPNAVVVVSLLERRQSQEETISELRIPLGSGPDQIKGIPVPFRLVAKCANLPADASYALSAAIFVDNQRWFASPEPLDVVLRPGEQHLRLLTVRTVDDSTNVNATLPRMDATASTPPQPGISVYAANAAQRGRKGAATLYLKPDQVYELHQESATATGSPNVSTGRWYRLSGGDVQLSGGSGNFTLLRRQDANLYAVAHKQLFQPVQRPLPQSPRDLNGVARLVGDELLFQDCASGQIFSLVGGNGVESVRLACQGKVREPETALPMRLRVRPAPAPEVTNAKAVTAAKVTPDAAQDAMPDTTAASSHARLLVDDLLGLDSTTNCLPMNDAFANAPAGVVQVPLADQANRALVGQRWKALYIAGKPVEVFDNLPEPHLSFRSVGATRGMLSGSDGCNSLSGEYGLSDSELRFSGLAATMRLCHEGEAQSRAFNQALARTSGWRLAGKVLELLDRDGVVAVFEGVAL